jgi:hypothetical protein
MKWQCSNPKCVTPCVLNISDLECAAPYECPFGCDNCDWQDAEEPEAAADVFRALGNALNPQNKKAL